MSRFSPSTRTVALVEIGAAGMFQLVLQFSPWSSGVAAFDKLVDVEDKLTSSLAGDAEVDGHDIGSNEANVFIITPDPLATLQRCFPVLEQAGLIHAFSAGHRALDGEHYTRDWPPGVAAPFEVK